MEKDAQADDDAQMDTDAHGCLADEKVIADERIRRQSTDNRMEIAQSSRHSPCAVFFLSHTQAELGHENTDGTRSVPATLRIMIQPSN
jgi:hypothetical protein